AVWDEVDFENAVWSIPKERMKRSKPHNVYLSRQALDIMIALKTCAGNSRYLLPSRYDADAPMSRATGRLCSRQVRQGGVGDRSPPPAFDQDAGVADQWLCLLRRHACQGSTSRLNSPDFRGHPRVTFPAAVRTQRVTASRS